MHFHKSDAWLDSLIMEDCPAMDLTVELLGIRDKPGELVCWPGQDGILSGVEEAALIWRKCGAEVRCSARNGDRAREGRIFLTASGTAGSLHKGLKIAQNLMEYMSGIATRTADMTARARAVHPGIRVSVTRKNFPGAKQICLEAASSGGADIHRLGLSDSVLVFAQHRAFLPDADARDPVEGFASLVPGLRRSLPERKLAAEVDRPEDAVALARAGLDIIQCEKFACPDLAATVRQIRAISPRTVILAAGGINGGNAADYAATGVDVLVTSWVYFGKPADIKIRVTASPLE
jgi:molybdenum transport protein